MEEGGSRLNIQLLIGVLTAYAVLIISVMAWT